MSLIYCYYASTCVKHFGPLALKQKDEDAVKRAYLHQARLHLLYFLSIIMNLVTMTVYWTVIHEKQVIKQRAVPIVGEGRVTHLYLVHTFPGFACLVNLFSTNVILKRSFWKGICIICVIYSIVQFVVIKTTGFIVYDFINFKDGWRSWACIAAITFGAMGAYLLLCIIDEFIKPVLAFRIARRKIKKHK